MTSAKGNKRKCGAGSEEVRSHLSHETSNADISPVLLMRHFAFSLSNEKCRDEDRYSRLSITRCFLPHELSHHEQGHEATNYRTIV